MCCLLSVAECVPFYKMITVQIIRIQKHSQPYTGTIGNAESKDIWEQSYYADFLAYDTTVLLVATSHFVVYIIASMPRFPTIK